MATSIQKRTNPQTLSEKNSRTTLEGYIKALAPEIEKALPSVITPERFTRMTLTALSSNPKLAQCTPKSFLGAMMNAAQLGLEPNTPLGQAYLIPYNNHGTMEVQFQIGYKGLVDLAYRSGEVSIIQAMIVYENDLFECEFGLDPKLKHIPADTNRGKPIKVYAYFKTQKGGYGFDVMSMEDAEEFARKNSQPYKQGRNTPWKTFFEEMAKKTILKRVLKLAPLKSDFVKAMSQDETIKTEMSPDMMDVRDELEAEYVEAEYTEADSDSEQADVVPLPEMPDDVE